jgi:hypothetical protein
LRIKKDEKDRQGKDDGRVKDDRRVKDDIYKKDEKRGDKEKDRRDVEVN